jgi:hypothetical protein
VRARWRSGDQANVKYLRAPGHPFPQLLMLSESDRRGI